MTGRDLLSAPSRAQRVPAPLALIAAVCWLIGSASRCAAQLPPIGPIEFYGLKRVSEAAVRQALQLSADSPAPASQEEMDAIVKRLRAVPGVQNAYTNILCCVNGKTAFFVGIEEKGATVLRFRSAPKGKVFLPKDVVQAGEDFKKALNEAMLSGDAAEDDAQGYSLMHNPAARAVQQRFLIYATRDPKPFQDVLQHSSDPAHRALAAQILGYAETEDQKVVDDLLQALSDPDSNVRNNAMRALAVRETYVQSNPASRIKIPYLPFIRLLKSFDWTDRNKAGFALIQLSQHRDVALLKSLRKEALPELLEMAKWKESGYGQIYFILLGRMVGLSDDAIYTAWKQGDYGKVFSAIQNS